MHLLGGLTCGGLGLFGELRCGINRFAELVRGYEAGFLRRVVGRGLSRLCGAFCFLRDLHRVGDHLLQLVRVHFVDALGRFLCDRPGLLGKLRCGGDCLAELVRWHRAGFCCGVAGGGLRCVSRESRFLCGLHRVRDYLPELVCRHRASFCCGVAGGGLRCISRESRFLRDLHRVGDHLLQLVHVHFVDALGRFLCDRPGLFGELRCGINRFAELVRGYEAGFLRRVVGRGLSRLCGAFCFLRDLHRVSDCLPELVRRHRAGFCCGVAGGGLRVLSRESRFFRGLHRVSYCLPELIRRHLMHLLSGLTCGRMCLLGEFRCGADGLAELVRRWMAGFLTRLQSERSRLFRDLLRFFGQSFHIPRMLGRFCSLVGVDSLLSLGFLRLLSGIKCGGTGVFSGLPRVFRRLCGVGYALQQGRGRLFVFFCSFPRGGLGILCGFFGLFGRFQCGLDCFLQLVRSGMFRFRVWCGGCGLCGLCRLACFLSGPLCVFCGFPGGFCDVRSHRRCRRFSRRLDFFSRRSDDVLFVLLAHSFDVDDA